MANKLVEGPVDAPVYRLKVTLKGSKPPIWRRIEVMGKTSLYKLHQVLQVVMGWEDYHMYEFEVGGVHYGEPDPSLGPDMKNSSRMKVAQIATGTKRRFTYTYDFGDDWEHEILIEKAQPVEAGVRYPRCTAGARACPPEDCGGMWGYVQLLEVIANPENPRHGERLEWIGENFDPEAFDLEGINRQLSRL
jgi:hypothetical protein